MWNYYRDNVNQGLSIDLSGSIYVGDAAGRSTGSGLFGNRKKDFSCSDRKFAHNIGIKFFTPEEFFLKCPAAPFSWDALDPHILSQEGEICEGGTSTLRSSRQELIVLVGLPASGKSTFCAIYLEPFGYVRINRDILKTADMCYRAAQQALESGKSVVIDNTSPRKEDRRPYVALATSYNVPSRCMWMQVDDKLSSHLSYFRQSQTQGRVSHIPQVAFNTYKKYFEEPTTGEGFTELKRINFVVNMELLQSDADKAMFFQYQ